MFSGFFSQNMYVFCSPKSLALLTSCISKVKSIRAMVSLIIAQANFCPMHLCLPSRKGSNASSLSSGYGDAVRKRSGMNELGSVKLDSERKVGYWFTETKVWNLLEQRLDPITNHAYPCRYVFTCNYCALLWRYAWLTDWGWGT